ncbi:MAG: hypothetical protein QM632_05585 [Micrococcaceae bacterium]
MNRTVAFDVMREASYAYEASLLNLADNNKINMQEYRDKYAAIEEEVRNVVREDPKEILKLARHFEKKFRELLVRIEQE